MEEKEAAAAARDRLAADAAGLEKEVALYEHDLEGAMDSSDDLAMEIDDLRARIKDERRRLPPQLLGATRQDAPPQLEFLLRSFERATKMRLSPLELGAYSAEAPQESRGANAREDFKTRDEEKWMKHTTG